MTFQESEDYHMAKAKEQALTTPANLPTTKEANFFQVAATEREEDEKLLEHVRKVDLLITPKGHQRLRAFGFEVIYTGKILPASTSDRRSL